jgi:hypothetical protein
MPTHLIIVPAEDPAHGIRILFADESGAGSLSPSYVDADGIAHKVPYDRVFPLDDAGLGYHGIGIASAVERLIREQFPVLNRARVAA